MTHAEYHLYATLFDALRAAADVDAHVGLQQYMGSTAGAVLRAWAQHHGLRAESDVGSMREGQHTKTWSRVRCHIQGKAGYLEIAVHLNDDILTPIAEVADLALGVPVAVEQEMPF